MSYNEYYQKVTHEIERRIGGTPGFVPNQFWVKYCFERNFHPNVAAIEAISDAIEAEKKGYTDLKLTEKKGK